MWRGMGEVGVREEMQVGLSFRNEKIQAAQDRQRGFGVGDGVVLVCVEGGPSTISNGDEDVGDLLATPFFSLSINA